MKFFPKKRPTAAENIEARAAAWLVEQDAGLTPEQEEKLAAWCAADPRHAVALSRLTRTWVSLQGLREYRPTARAYPDPDLLSPARTSHRWFSQAAVALPFAAMLVCGVFWWSAHSAPTDRLADQSYTTTAGGYERVALEDGSVVELNSSTDIRVRYSRTIRQVKLLRGEAHFTVAQNKRRPFFVAADGVTVRAVGTAFDVRVAPQGIEVLVTAGIVQLGHATGESANLSSAATTATPLVTAGWRAFIPHGETAVPSIEKVASPVARDLLAWQSSRLVFVEMPLGEVIEQFNQRNQVQLSVADPELAKMPIGGSFAADNVETFVRLLSSNGDLAVEQVSPDQIILHKTH